MPEEMDGILTRSRPKWNLEPVSWADLDEDDNSVLTESLSLGNDHKKNSKEEESE
jgi:hypothetical protein